MKVVTFMPVLMVWSLWWFKMSLMLKPQNMQFH